MMNQISNLFIFTYHWNGQVEFTFVRGNEYCSSASEHVKRDHFGMKWKWSVKFLQWALRLHHFPGPLSLITQFMLFALPKKPTWSPVSALPCSLLPAKLPQRPTLPSQKGPLPQGLPAHIPLGFDTSQHSFQCYKQWNFLMFLNSNFDFLKQNLVSTFGEKNGH